MAGITVGRRGVEDDGVALVDSWLDSMDQDEEGGEAELWEASDGLGKLGFAGGVGIGAARERECEGSSRSRLRRGNGMGVGAWWSSEVWVRVRAGCGRGRNTPGKNDSVTPEINLAQIAHSRAGLALAIVNCTRRRYPYYPRRFLGRIAGGTSRSIWAFWPNLPPAVSVPTRRR